MLPNDCPPGKVCRATSGNGRKAVFGQGLMKSLSQEVGGTSGRHKAGTGMIDSQAVKTTEKEGPKECLPTEFR